MSHRVTLLWFNDCPGHESARQIVADVVARVAPNATIEDANASDTGVAVALRFPGSPTIRVDDVDIEPGFADPGDYTPRCRLYRTAAGLAGLPEPRWLEEALRARPRPSLETARACLDAPSDSSTSRSAGTSSRGSSPSRPDSRRARSRCSGSASTPSSSRRRAP